MQTIRIKDYDQWRAVSRKLVATGRSYNSVTLVDDREQQSLFDGDNLYIEKELPSDSSKRFSVPREFLTLSETVSYHRHSFRWNLLYRTLWRIVTLQSRLLDIATDEDVMQLNQMEKEVRRDAHKMKAFVRFRKVNRDGAQHFIAWHRPDHRIVRKVAPFFSRRFKTMNWTILTPDESVVWNQKELVYGAGVPRSEAPDGDELETLWKTYYASIFNPARIKIKMMKSEMPVRHWATLPETEIIHELLAEAPGRVAKMISEREGFSATALQQIETSPSRPENLDQLHELAKKCTACDLHLRATQTVFGEGPAIAKLVLIGEQPGDQEDNAGRPFVGPAGAVLDDALVSTGISREAIYLTNVVKHFKYTDSKSGSGKRRLHQRPSSREVRCCRPWFDAEWSFLSEAVVLVCLGASAAQAIIGPNFRVSVDRGKFVETDYCANTIATWHPSAILRTPDSAQRFAKTNQLVEDLRLANLRIGI